MSGLPVFVINLARDGERRAFMQRQLAERQVSAEFIDATDGKRLSPAELAVCDQRKALRIYGRTMATSEVACCLSHFGIYERMLAEGIEVAAIFEDDVQLVEDVASVLDTARERLPADCLVLRLDTKRTQVAAGQDAAHRGIEAVPLGDGRAIWRLTTRVLGVGGYLIRKEGAARMLRYARPVFMPIDQMMDRYWENGIDPFVVRPFPVLQGDDFGSHSQAARSSARTDVPLPTRLRHRLQRMEDSVRKRLYRIAHAPRG